MTCSVEGCDRPIRYKGMCGMHYKRAWRHGDPNKTYTPTRGFERAQCIVEECEAVANYGNGMCALHYQRFNRYGRTHNIIAPKGTFSITNAGYIMMTVNGRRVLEHVLKAEKALGKPLPKGAVVHHMNCKSWDNDTPFNLIVCPDQAYHLLLHRRMKELGYEGN